MSCPNGRKEFNNNDSSSKATNDLGVLRSPAPACDPALPNDKGGAETSEYALPAALAASGIPRVVVLDENAVYDHYMRRLNRVWMKRLKAGRGKARIDWNHQHSSPPFCKPDARPTSVPLFIREMDPVVHPRRQRRPSGGGAGPEDYQVAGQDYTRARLRPKSAPVFEGRPSPAWAEVRDRNRAAVGPGPTSSIHCHNVGGVGESKRALSRARPDSAPNLQRRAQRDAALSSFENYKQKHRPSTRLAPRVARLERETHGLLTDCRKAARTRNDTIHAFSENSRHGRNPMEPLPSGREHYRRKSDRSVAGLSESNERIENLGRGAVVRLVGSLGMGRYAHRFRAFAVTGSDLVSCTEEDLVQIGVSFRPHRIRLMREIEQRKLRSSSGDAWARAESEVLEAETPVACEPRSFSATSPQDVLARQPSSSASEKNTTQVSPGRANNGVLVEETQMACEPRPSSATNIEDVLTNPPPPSVLERATPQVSPGPESVKRGVQVAETQVACQPRPALATDHQDVLTNPPPPSVSEQNTPLVSSGRTELTVDSPPIPMAYPAGNRAGSSSTSTACTAYTNTTPQMRLPAQSAEVQRSSTEAAAGRSHCASPEVESEGGGENQGSRSTEVEGSEPLRSGRKRSFEQEDKEGAACPWEGPAATKDSCAPPSDVPRGATDVVPLPVSSDASAERRIKTPRLKSTLEVSDVSADDVKAVPGGRESFLRVRVCDQLQQAGTTAGKALEVSWRNAVLSFSVTERDLATGSIHIELCGGGIGAQDLIASGAIPGDVTLQLICRSRTQNLEKGCSAEERDRAAAFTRTEPAAIGNKVAVGVRLFAAAGGGDVGVCTLNLKIRPDDDDEAAKGAIEHEDQPETPAGTMRKENIEKSAPSSASLVAVEAVPSVIPDTAATVEAEAGVETEVAEPAVAGPTKEERKRHLVILEEAARHIETIEEACQLVRRQHELLGIPDARKGDNNWLPTQTGKASHSAAVDARKVAGAGALPRYRHPSTADERDAVVVVRSQCRRRAARKVAKRRAKERKAASKASKARQSEFLLEQRRDDAAVTLQSSARRRISVNAVRRRRNEREEARLSESNRDAAATATATATAAAADSIPGFTNNLLHDNSRREHAVVTKVQETARVCEANAEVTQREENVFGARDASIQKKPMIEAGSDRSEWWESDSPESIELQTSARSYAATKAVDYLQRATEAESLRRASIEAEKKVDTEIKRKLQEEVEMEAEQHRAASGIQRVARSKQANNHVATLRRKRDADNLRARQLELEQQMIVQREAAGCIQRLARNHRAAERVATLRRQRDADNRRDLAVEAAKQVATRQGAAACIQRAGRSRQARLRVTAATREKAIEIKRRQKEAEMEAERHHAALGIQRVARSKQANEHVAVLRQQRDTDNLRARQLELELEQIAQREAAERIQRLSRSRRAVERVATLRQQREIDIQRDLAVASAKKTATERDAASCIQRVGRSRQARLRVTAARRERDAESKRRQEEAEMEAERHHAALGIQCVARSKRANDHVAVLRQKRDADNLRARQLELELEQIAQREAAERIQRLARSHHAVERVATLRQQREIDIQRDLAVAFAKKTATERDAASCIQRVGRSRKARLRVTAARRERDVEIKRKQEAEMEAERHRAALGIQRVARSKQASDRVAVLRQKRDVDNLRARQLELELELITQREAAERIQRLARSHRANERVATLRQQRKIDIQRDLAAELAKQTAAREDAAACIQRLARSRKARLRVTAVRRERDVEIKRKQKEAEMEAERHHAALGIQRVARSKQASEHVAVLRQKRDADNLRARQLELELEQTAQREAAERIQCLARRHHAVERVATLRQQREIDTQQDLAVDLAKQTASREDAAACIQRAGRSRQARLRVTAARRERDIEIKRKQNEAETEAERHRAALGIQRAARSKQARDHVAVLRKMRDADNLRTRQLELELEMIHQREAAERIQCLVRSHRAVERVATLRQQRDINTQRDLAMESAKQTATREDAAACIQRLARSRQARLRTSALRKQREIDTQSEVEEAELGHAMAAQEKAAACIQRSVKTRQAVKRVSAIRGQREVDVQHSSLELEITSQASERVADLTQVQDTNAKREVEVEVDVGVREKGVQQGRGLQEEAAAEQEPESMSSMFARMMETARKSSIAGVGVAGAGLETTSALSPFPGQHTGKTEVVKLTGSPEGNIPIEASNFSAESNHRVDDDTDNAEKKRGEREGGETKQVVMAPGSSGAFDGNTSAAARAADGNGLLEHDAQIERVRRSSSSESAGWGGKSSDASSDTQESESSGTSDDSEEERETRGALPVSDADSGDRTRQERYAPSGIDDQNGADRDNNVVGVLASSSVEEISPTTAPAGGANDEVMAFGEEGGNLSEESVETADSASLASAAIIAPEGDSLKGDNEPLSRDDGRSSTDPAALSLATVDDNTEDREPQLGEPNPHDVDEEEEAVIHRSDSDLPASSSANYHDDGTERFPVDHDVMADHDAMEDWETHLDEETGRVYYYNAKSGVTSWDHPRGGTGEVEHTPGHTADEGVAVHTEEGDVQGVPLVEAAVTGPALVAAATVETEIQPLGAEWAAGVDGGGRQQATPETREDESDARGTIHHAEEVIGQAIEGRAVAAERGNDHDQRETATDVESFPPNEGNDGRLEEEEVVQSSSAAAAGEGVEAGKEEEVHWEEIIDPDSGHKYFYNPATRQSTWALPDGVLATAAANAAAAVAAAAAAAAATEGG